MLDARLRGGGHAKDKLGRPGRRLGHDTRSSSSAPVASL